MDTTATASTEAAKQLKTWIRFNRRKGRLTQPQLAKLVGVHTQDVFRWEHLACDDLPDTAQLAAVAAAVRRRVPSLPKGLIAEPMMGLPAGSSPTVDDEAPLLCRIDEPITEPGALKHWLWLVRRQARLTQSALADMIEVSPLTVSHWENLGTHSVPPWPALMRIAESCGVPVPEISPAVKLRGRPPKPFPLDPAMPPAGSLMEEIAQTAARLYPSDEGEGLSRNASLFLDYYGRGMTLNAVGEAHRLTRERVRQVIARMMESLAWLPPPRAKFLELAARCQTLSPMPVTSAEAELAEVLGGVSLASAATYGAHVLGEALPVEVDTDQAVPMVLPRGLPNWVTLALRQARRMIRFNGAALFDQVWAATQAEQTTPVKPDSLRAVLHSVYGFTWLDPTEQWFWFGPDHGPNRVLDWSRRILATAGRRVDVVHVHAGIARTRLRQDDNSPTSILPPASVLLTMLASCPDIEVKQGDDLKLIDTALVPGLEPDSIIEQVLELLRGQGGVMAYGDIVEALVEGQGLVQISLSVQLSNSPLIRRLDHGIYAIRGWRIMPDAVERAWRATLPRSAIEVAFGVDGSLAWDFTLTAAVIEYDRMYLPQGVRHALGLGVYAVRGGGEVRVVGAEDNAQIRGLGALALGMGGEAGDRFRLTVWPALREVEFEPI